MCKGTKQADHNSIQGLPSAVEQSPSAVGVPGVSLSHCGGQDLAPNSGIPQHVHARPANDQFVLN